MTSASLALENSASAPAEAMEWESRAKRAVFLYVPLACFVFILLFPFYWMTITAFKPNAELYSYKTRNAARRRDECAEVLLTVESIA
jgi:multiple sugar transport system permease protein